MTRKMKAVIVTTAGGPEVLKYTEVDMPSIQHATDILIRVIAAGMNPGDCQNRASGAPSYAAGDGQSTFSILGMDGVGIVEQTGQAITHLRPGDEVWYYDGGYSDKPGSYAEFKVVSGHYVTLKPKSINFTEAAAFPTVCLTSWEAVVERARVREGNFVLVHGGAGGLGHISIQLAHARGARVATTVSSLEKGKLARELGAELLIDYKRDNVKQAVARWTGKDGADIILDYVGRENFSGSMDLVAPYGTLVNTVVAPWPEGNNMLAEYKNLNIKFINIGLPQVSANHEYRLRQTRVLRHIAELVDAGTLQVHLHRVYQLRDVKEAHRALEAGEVIGRIVITI
ncbi:zinc-binding dehydrogenase [Noviherbaspirillum aerium]|uniref:zinc-binding dehydrogenase n=1 Tax=Noviherbaspirillum aerium TaxID=2588497 RepID=UPI00124D7E9A|nr:zinc-binding dehydrogenase [Noviherbaspirillum aerium]